jgi:Zn-dependent protease/CBS domain-containing protein
VGAGINLGRIWGIPIGLHWSFFLVFAILTTSLGGGYFPDQYPELSSAATWFLALLTSVLFFASILLHELGHTWVALRNKIPVQSITLFALGGVAQIGEPSRSAAVEFRIAAGGPLVSLILAAAFGLLWVLDRGISSLAAPSIWLARINLALLLFNLLPGYPLDGGRMLRAAVWYFSRDEKKGARVALVSGQLLSFGLMGIGALLVLNGRFVDGIWFIFIGWFLQNTAVAEQASATVQGQLRGASVAQAMGLVDEPQVPSRLKLRQLVEEFVLTSGQGFFLVVDGDQPRGVLTLRQVTQVPRDRWDWVSVADVMTPWSQLQRVNPNTELLTALQAMDEGKLGQVPVVDGDKLVGLLTRDEILRYLRVRAELRM